MVCLCLFLCHIERLVFLCLCVDQIYGVFVLVFVSYRKVSVFVFVCLPNLWCVCVCFCDI